MATDVDVDDDEEDDGDDVCRWERRPASGPTGLVAHTLRSPDTDDEILSELATCQTLELSRAGGSF